METGALSDILERIQSPSGNADGLLRLREWLQDSRNIARAAAEAEIFPLIVRVLLAFMGQQLSLAVRSTSKKAAFKAEGATCLEQVVRAACKFGSRRSGQMPLLSRSQRKLWEHLAEMLNSEVVAQKQPSLLPYYCRTVKELADRSHLGYLSEMRGERLRIVLHALLQMPPSDSAQAVGLEAAAVLVQRVNGDPGPEVPWLCDKVVELLRYGGQPSLGLLSAIVARCPFDFRDWLLVSGNAEKLVTAALAVWSSGPVRSSEVLDLILHMTFEIVDPPSLQKAAAALLPLAADTMENLVKDTPAGDAIRSSRVARLTDLLVVALLRCEGSLTAAVQRICSQVESKTLAWALCAARLCETHPQALCAGGDDSCLRHLCEALHLQLQRGSRLKSPELAATCAGLASALCVPLWLRVCQLEHRNGPPVPSYLSQLWSTDGSAIMLMDLLHSRPQWGLYNSRGWQCLLQQLADLAVHALGQGGLRPTEGLYQLLAAIFLVAAPPVADDAARHVVALQALPRPGHTATAGQMMRCCLLAAVRRQRPSAAAHRDLIRAMALESIDLRVSCLRLCAEDAGSTSFSSSFSSASHDGSRGSSSSSGHSKPGPDVQQSSGGLFEPTELEPSTQDHESERLIDGLPMYWRHRLDALRQAESRCLELAMDTGAPAMPSGATGPLLDSYRAQTLCEALNFQLPATDVQLGLMDGVDASLPTSEELIIERPTNAAACAAAIEVFRSQYEACFGEATKPSQGRELTPYSMRAVNLLSSVTLLVRLTVTAEKPWCTDLLESIRVLLVAACEHPGTSPGHGTIGLGEFYEGLLEFVIAVERVQDCNIWYLPEILEPAAELAESLSSSWLRTKDRDNDADAFEMRGSSRPPQPAAGSVPKAVTLRLLIALACLDPGPEMKCKDVLHPRILRAFADLLQRVARLEPGMLIPLLRMISAELAPHSRRRPLLRPVLEAMRTAPDPLCSQDFEDSVLIALRLLAYAAKADHEALQEAVTMLWVGAGGHQARLVSLVTRWRSDPDWLAPRGKVLLAALLTRTLELLKGLPHLEHIQQNVAEHCMNCVPHLLVTDRNCEVRFGVGRACTRPLFELFDESQVYEEVCSLYRELPRGIAGEPITSSAIATMQVMIETAQFTGYMHRIIPELCNLSACLRPKVRAALRSLDGVMGGGVQANGSVVALRFRTQVFARYVQEGGRLSTFPLQELCMESALQHDTRGMYLHLPSAVAALALTEELQQLQELAAACGLPPDGREFLELIFVPLAGSLLPMRRTLQPLCERYGADRIAALAQERAADLVAFSWHLPFLTLGGTSGSGHRIDAQALRTAYEESDPQSPWADFPAFVSTHFRALAAALDQVLCAAATWGPAVATDLIRCFASWAGPLSAGRLRIFVTMLVRHGRVLPVPQRLELCTVAEVVLDSAKPDAISKLVLHQDQSLQNIMAAVEEQWGVRCQRASSQPVSQPSSCIAIRSLQAVLRAIQKLSEVEGSKWIRLSVEALVPRLDAAAAQMVSEALGAAFDVPAERSVKRQRTMEVMPIAVAEKGSLASLFPDQPDLDWGCRSVPDLGALGKALLEEISSAEATLPPVLLGRVLRLLVQPQVLSQLRRDRSLSQSVCLALASIEPSSVLLQLSLEDQEGEVLESVLHQAVLPKHGSLQKGLAVNELLCCAVLLGASALQVHPCSRVRDAALSTLQHIAGLPSIFQASRSVLTSLLHPKHICLEDMADISVKQFAASAGHAAAGGDRDSLGAGIAANGDVNWETLFCAETHRGLSFSAWIISCCSSLLALAAAGRWEKPAIGLLPACVPLASMVDWFAERVLVLVILKATSHPQGGKQVAEALTGFFRQASPEPMRAQCLLKALHLVRSHQTHARGRCVPNYPVDTGDPFWAAIDLCAVAKCASQAGWPRDGLLFLELHLARENPDVSINLALLKDSSDLSVGDLFKPLSKEVKLLHQLSQQLPDDELLYGVSQWCHAESRLAQSVLGRDQLTSLYLRSDQRTMEAALADLGLHNVLASGAPPSAEASAETWDRRMEALWRLQKWDAVAGVDGFNAQLHAGLAAIAHQSEPTLSQAAAAAVEVPLSTLVPKVVTGFDGGGGSAEELRHMAVRLQMLGSILDYTQVMKGSNGSSSDSSPALAGLLTRWLPRSPAGLSEQRFRMLEPLHSLRATLLSMSREPATELHFLTGFAEATRQAGQPHRALGLLERAQGISGGATTTRLAVLRLHMEQARCFWDLKQPQQAICIASAVSSECRLRASGTAASISGASSAAGPGADAASPANLSWMSRVLSDTGDWLSIARLESADIIRQEFLEPAVTMDAGSVQPRRQLADFLDARLVEELSRQGSLEHAIYSDLHRRTQAELADAQRELHALEQAPEGKEQEMLALKEQIRSHQTQAERDKLREEGSRRRLQTLSTQCVQQLGQCLMQGSATANLTKVACRFLSLWFDYGREFQEVTQCVKESLSRLQLGPLTPFIYQLASRLGGNRDELQSTLEELLVRLGATSAQALWPLLLLRNGDQVPKGMRGAARFVPDVAKIDAAKRLLERLRGQAAVRPVLEAVETLSRFYLAVAYHNVDKKNRETEVPLSTIHGYKEVKKVLTKKVVPIPVPTATTQSSSVASNPSSSSSSQARGPIIASFKESFGIAKQGLSAPRILKLTDTEGREHRQCVKGMDDVRQDAVMQQLFSLLNELFSESAQARQANLRLRTFQVVPLSPCAGMMEWVVDTVTLGEMLTGNTNPAEGAHARYRPQDWPHHSCRRHMQLAFEAQTKGQSNALKTAFTEVCERFRPVMHLMFLEYFPTPREWHKARQHYARSAAVSSMVGHVVGIGDRHPNNILFDYRTGDLVHIDFGIVFDQGRVLRVPELVPFRLTRDMVAVLGCLGTCGPFQRCCEATLEVLRRNSALVTAITEVFVHDPVYHWSLDKRKARQTDGGGVGDGTVQAQDHPVWPLAATAVGASATEGNEMARRALLAVKGKLHGEHEAGASLGVAAQVGWLIHEAMDQANLAHMYFGWSPWL